LFLVIAKIDERVLAEDELIETYTRPLSLCFVGFMVALDSFFYFMGEKYKNRIMFFYLDVVNKYSNSKGENSE
jgi:hypothetical protein